MASPMLEVGDAEGERVAQAALSVRLRHCNDQNVTLLLPSPPIASPTALATSTCTV
jgi:hypothetical protein